MTDSLNVALKLSVDKKEGETNLKAFNRSFDSAMKGIGKSGNDVDTFKNLAKDINEGKVKVDQLDTETQQLYKTYKEGAQLAASRDILGIKAHVEIQREIDETKLAYDRLKKSGKLSQTELAQAAIKTEDRIRKLKKETNGWAESLENAKGSIAGLIATSAGLAVMTGEAIEFEAAMADVKKVLGGTDSQMQALGTQIKELSTELPISADGLAQIAAAGGQLGVPIEKLGEFIDLSAKMSVAFDISAEQAGQAVAKLSNIFNIPIDDIEKLGDAINVLGNTTAAKEADIVNVLTRIGGSASQFKLTAEQSAALAATFISMGATAEIAGTGINALLSKLQTANVQGPQFKQALAEMGLSAHQLGNDIRENPQEALNRFLRTLNEIEEQSRAEILFRLFGAEYQDDIARLLNGLDKYDASLALIADTGKTTNAMQKEFAARIETTEAQIQLLKNGLEYVAINLGSIFLPAVREMAEGLGDASAALARFIETYPSIAGITTILGTAAVSVGALRIAMLSMRYVGVKAFGDISQHVKIANLDMKGLVAETGKVGAAIRAAGGAFVSWQIGRDIGTYLVKEFEIVEKLGIEMAAAFTQLAAAAKFAWDVIADPGNASAAYDALLAELDQVQTIYGKMYVEVGKVNTQQKVTKTTAQELAAALNATGKEGSQAAADIKTAFQKIDLTTPKGIIDLTAAIDLAGSKIGLLDKQVEDWIKKANASDLNGFKNQIKTAFNDGQLSAEQLAKYNDDILSASFQKLGLVAETALGKISPAATEAIGNLKIIQQTLSDSSIDGATKMRALEIAIKGALASADTTAAVNALSTEVKTLADSGQLSAEQLARLNKELEKQKQLTADSLPGIQSVEEAMKQLGLTSQSEMKKSAEEMAKALAQLEAMKAPYLI
ncbi:MAG: phage tail tape measure protein [Oleispira sp.]|nr:phage tail tape measure protein [Oleispira sp.]